MVTSGILRSTKFSVRVLSRRRSGKPLPGRIRVGLTAGLECMVHPGHVLKSGACRYRRIRPASGGKGQTEEGRLGPGILRHANSQSQLRRHLLRAGNGACTHRWTPLADRLCKSPLGGTTGMKQPFLPSMYRHGLLAKNRALQVLREMLDPWNLT